MCEGNVDVISDGICDQFVKVYFLNNKLTFFPVDLCKRHYRPPNLRVRILKVKKKIIVFNFIKIKNNSYSVNLGGVVGYTCIFASYKVVGSISLKKSV